MSLGINGGDDLNPVVHFHPDAEVVLIRQPVLRVASPSRPPLRAADARATWGLLHSVRPSARQPSSTSWPCAPRAVVEEGPLSARPEGWCGRRCGADETAECHQRAAPRPSAATSCPPAPSVVPPYSSRRTRCSSVGLGCVIKRAVSRCRGQMPSKCTFVAPMRASSVTTLGREPLRWKSTCHSASRMDRSAAHFR